MHDTPKRENGKCWQLYSYAYNRCMATTFFTSLYIRIDHGVQNWWPLAAIDRWSLTQYSSQGEFWVAHVAGDRWDRWPPRQVWLSCMYWHPILQGQRIPWVNSHLLEPFSHIFIVHVCYITLMVFLSLYVCTYCRMSILKQMQLQVLKSCIDHTCHCTLQVVGLLTPTGMRYYVSVMKCSVVVRLVKCSVQIVASVLVIYFTLMCIGMWHGVECTKH